MGCVGRHVLSALGGLRKQIGDRPAENAGPVQAGDREGGSPGFFDDAGVTRPIDKGFAAVVQNLVLENGQTLV